MSAPTSDGTTAAERLRLVIIVEPTGLSEHFGARLAGSGRVIVASSRQPLFDSARKLIDSGHDPASVLEMWREGAAAFAMRGPLWALAKLDVRDAKFAKHSSHGNSREKANARAAHATDGAAGTLGRRMQPRIGEPRARQDDGRG